MDAARALIERFWIVRTQDKELYYKTKNSLGTIRRFLTEQLGWNLVQNENILKLEKIPAHAESYMGIAEFTEIRDYCLFCALLIFLEDREDGEQFLLSELVSMIEAQLQEYTEIDWTQFVQRKSLVRVLKYAEEAGLLQVYDGSSDRVSGGMEQEVLYENTGLSRYFAVTFPFSIADFQSYQDFEQSSLKDVDTDRGRFRTQRVYRQLVAAPALYWSSGEDPDALYLRNQRQWVSRYLEEYLGGELQIHRNAAFLVLDEADTWGETHPRDAGISEATLSLCALIREEQETGCLLREKDDIIWMTAEDFDELLRRCKMRYQKAWSKEYREMPMDKLYRGILDYMISYMLAAEEKEEVWIYPAAVKFIGAYPEDFLDKE